MGVLDSFWSAVLPGQSETQVSSCPGWTPDRVETLTRLWNDGLTASVIAARLGGITSSAVIGKTQRLGLPPRRTGHRRQKPACMFRIERPRIQPKVPTLLHASLATIHRRRKRKHPETNDTRAGAEI